MQKAQLATSFLHKHAFSFGVVAILLTFIFFASSFVVANGQTLQPNDRYIVSLYIDGQEQIIPTRAKTVGELLEKSDIKLAPEDLVEPAVQTPIESDNLNINVYKARPVTILDEGKQSTVLTPHQGAKMITEKAGLTVYPEDTITMQKADTIEDNKIIGEKIEIDLATPVSVSLYGVPAVTYRTNTTTVADLLKEKNITPEQGATVTPDPSTVLSPNMPIFISKFGKQVVNTTEQIGFETQTTPDPNQTSGQVTVTKAGKNGVKQVVYEVETRDGKEISRTKIQETVTEQPVNQEQTKGTKPAAAVTGDKLEWMRAAGISEADFNAVDFVIGHESGWRPGALNAGGCAGLGQACPGSELAAVCPSWQTDPVCQLKFFSGYAGRYGGWQGALNAWNSKGWW